MQNKAFVLASGAATVQTQNGCEALDLLGTAAFSVTYADYQGGQQIGDAAPAIAFGAVFKFTVYAPRGSAFKPGQTVAYISGGGAQTVTAAPVRLN